MRILSISLLAMATLVSPTTSHSSVGDQIDNLFESFSTSTPGCSVAAAREGKTIFNRSFGSANLEHEIANTLETRFYAASVSKQFTAAAIALLVLDGELSLDDSIQQFFPELPAYAEQISVRQLVHHTSGLRDYLDLLALGGRDFGNAMSTEEVIEIIARQKATNFEPGTEFLYSNTGYFLLAELVARVTHSSFQEFVEQRIFNPFGMSHSHFHADYRALIRHRAEGYIRVEDQWKSNRSRFAQAGSTGLFTTALDLLKWNAMLYGDDHKPLAKLVLTKGKLSSGKELPYAFGLTYGETHGLPNVSHSGALGGYRAHLTWYPAQQFSVALLCNLDKVNTNLIISRIAEIALVESLKKKSASPINTIAEVDDKLLNAYIGKYALAPQLSIAITRENNSLFSQVTGQEKLGIFPRSEAEFFYKAVDAQITFKRETDGAVDEIILHQNGRDYPSKRITTIEKPHQPLGNYAGTYSSEELNASVSLFVENGALWSRFGRNPPRQLQTSGDGKFSIGSTIIQPLVGSEGSIEGMLLDTWRVRGIRYERK